MALVCGVFCAVLTGCSSDRADGERSVVDTLSEMQEASAALERPPAPDPNAVAVEQPTDISGKSASGGSVAGAATSSGTFTVKFETSAGEFTVLVHRDWAPLGAQRFYELVKDGFYDECRFFRVVPGFMVQFGMNGDPAVQRRWDREFPDDKVVKSNTRGMVTFAKTGAPDSRSTQIFVNYGNNSFLDKDRFAPFGEVIDGMHNVEGINSQYGEKPDQGSIKRSGNAYLKSSFPELDYVKKATIVEEVP
jgi:cyclophilin family peptidyl-prolyl cis-trans isomerase